MSYGGHEFSKETSAYGAGPSGSKGGGGKKGGKSDGDGPQVGNEKKKTPMGDRSLRPVTLRMVLNSDEREGAHYIENREVSYVKIVGCVINDIITSRTSSKVVYEVEDGTGKMDVDECKSGVLESRLYLRTIRWLTPRRGVRGGGGL